MKTAPSMCASLAISVACGAAFAADPPTPKLDGAAIEPDAALEAPDGARELELPDGVHVTLHAGASAKLGRPVWFPAEHGVKSARGYRLFVRQGDVTIRVPDDPRGLSGLSATTRSGDAVIDWHGTVRLSVGASESRAELLDGASFIGSRDKWTIARGPSGIAFDTAGEAQLHHALLGPPAWTDAQPRLAVLRGDATQRPSLAWRAVPRATGYKVEIASDERVVSTATVDAESLEMPALPSGRYLARVAAVGSDKMVGEPSAPLPFHIVRATLPAGAIVAPDGAVVLREGSTVTLDEHRGLELAVAEADDVASARSDAFAPHPAGLGPTRKRVAVVRIRDTDTHAESTMMLVRRELRARVELTPRLARWPSDPVTVNVTLKDPSGRVDPSKEAVAIDARIDGRPLALAWQETRGAGERSWSARIDPRTGAGPWLIDVQVKDAAGTILGESLLDVDGPRPAALSRAQ
jgi:hypothetical protein